MLHAPAAEKNKEPIGVALSHFGPFSQHDSGKTYKCLELGSGSGEHAAHLGKLFPYVVWQPTEYQGDVGPEWVPEEMRDEFSNFNSIKEHTKLLSNVLPPIELDAADAVWPGVIESQKWDAVFAANVFHAAPYGVAIGIIAGAARVLDPEAGGLFVYDTFKLEGKVFSHSIPISPTCHAPFFPYLTCISVFFGSTRPRRIANTTGRSSRRMLIGVCATRLS